MISRGIEISSIPFFVNREYDFLKGDVEKDFKVEMENGK